MGRRKVALFYLVQDDILVDGDAVVDVLSSVEAAIAMRGGRNADSSADDALSAAS